MLQNLSDPDALGPAMAIAMLTTYYAIFLVAALSLPGEMLVRFNDETEGGQS